MATREQISTVGPKELVDFPVLGIKNVPAKIDTGADTSAVWASNVHEKNGTLSFTLFDQVSPFYTGEVLGTKNFSVASIKNSFGHTEFRYKVTLKIALADRTINVRFTLANRENNSQPILIGRRTLHGKFLVDVARTTQKKTIDMLLITIKRTDRIQNFIANLENHNPKLRITLAVYDDLLFSFGTEGRRVALTGNDRDIATFDVVHFKATPRRYLDIAATAAGYLRKRGVEFFDQAVAVYPGNSKLYQYAVLSDNGVAVPQSVFAAPEALSLQFQSLKETFGVPFILKDIYASKGRDNHLITGREQFEQLCKVAAENEHRMIAQQFIPNDGDYRVLIMGRKVALILHRSRSGSETHLNNTSLGGAASMQTEASLPTQVLQDSLFAAQLLGREIAGVDMVQDKISGSWYCLEVNEDPQIATGAFVDEKLASFARYIEIRGGEV